MASTRRGPLTILTAFKGLITEFRILRTQLRALITPLITRGGGGGGLLVAPIQRAE